MRNIVRPAVVGLMLCPLLAGDIARAADASADTHSKVDDGTHALASMNETLAQVKAKAKNAQDSRDPIKLNCVSEKSIQIQQIIGIAQTSLEDLRNFVTSGELEAADHELEKINIAKEKTNGYKADADACVGQIEVGDGKVVIIYTEGDVANAVDPTSQVTPAPTTFRPSPASPTQ